eukprot:6977202-Pyramimonas_sp.AAC.1
MYYEKRGVRKRAIRGTRVPTVLWLTVYRQFPLESAGELVGKKNLDGAFGECWSIENLVLKI